MNKYLLFIFLFASVDTVKAQEERAQIKGVLIDKMSQQPLAGAQIFVPQLKMLFICNENGAFDVTSIPFGSYSFYVRNEWGEMQDSFKLMIRQSVVVLDTIAIAKTLFIKDTLVVSVNEPDESILVEEDGISSSTTSILLHASGTNEPFLNALSFVFSGFQVQPRADRKGQQVWLNGILMNDVLTKQANWSSWSGLNELFKNQNLSYGIRAAHNAFGGLNGNVAFDFAPLEQSKQMKFAYGIANKTYQHKLMFSYHSGLSVHNSAWSISMSRRWADESYVPGTYFNAFAIGVSWAKIIHKRQQVLCHFIAAPSERGRSGTATEEVYALAKSRYYNAYWGWQNDQKRNARTIRTIQPMLQLQHLFSLNEKVQIKTSALAQIGTQARQGLDWYQAQDPRPDYYRNLPSYYATSFPSIAKELQAEIEHNPEHLQIDWTRLYAANRSHQDSVTDANGILGNTVRGNRSLYVLSSDVERSSKVAIATNVQYKLNQVVFLSGGIHYIFQQVNYFKRLDDLLGGDYFLNANQFAAQQFAPQQQMMQYDLLQSNRAVRQGERYNYNYKVNAHQAFSWSQLEYDTRKWNMFAALSLNYIAYQRIGLYQHGLFPNHSLGRSPMIAFMQATTKMGIQYKLNGRNYFYAHALLGSQEPGFDQVFISARTRNQTLDTIEQAMNASCEIGYFLKAPKLIIRASLYATAINGITSIQRFYNDDPAFQTYVNFVQQHLNTQSIGVEFGMSYAITSLWALQAAAVIGQSFYTNNPKVLVFTDNDTNTHPVAQSVFIKNYYQGVGPQSAYTLGITHNSKRYWFAKANLVCIDRNYVSINPARRSIAAAELIDRGSPEFTAIFGQEKLPLLFNVQLSGGKSIRLRKIFPQMKYTTSMYLSVGINNLLPQRNCKLMGYEQLRYDFVQNNPNKFPNKYVYGFGTTFFIQASLKL